VIIRRIFSVFIVVWLLALPAPVSATEPSASDAVDLSNWSFEQDGAVTLNYGWTVFRDRILGPENFTDGKCSSIQLDQGLEGERLTLPDIWGPAFTSTVYSGHGKATYCADIIFPKSDDFFALRMGALRSVSVIYAISTNLVGERQTLLLHKNGDLLATAEQIVNNPDLPKITLPHGVQRMTLILQLSNKVHKQGGIVEVPILDLSWRLAALENRETGMPSALVIVLLMIGFAALIFGSRGNHSKEHYFFAFLAFAAGMRVLFVSDIIWDYFPAFSLARKYDLEYLSLFVIAVAYYAFVNDLLRSQKTSKIDYIIYGITGSLIGFALFLAPFFPAGTITLFREATQVLWGSIIIMVVWVVFQATTQNAIQRREAIVVSLAGLGYATYEILSTTGVIGLSLEWSQLVVLIVVLMHAQAFVMKARRIEQERDELTTRLQEANRDLQNRAVALDLALEKAETASHAKSNFLATFSHELRTPLNAIIGFSEVMKREVFGPFGSKFYKEYAGDIHASGKHLLGLVDDILDLSLIEAGTLELTEEKVDLKQVTRTTMNLLKMQAKHHNITMKLETSGQPPVFLADHRKISQVMINLIANAIQFNKKDGKVTIHIEAGPSGLYVTIEDTGIGMREEEIPLALTRYGQADSSRRDENTGVGIGLPLSEALVRQHDGTLTITSEVGVGTRVVLWFPPERLLAA